MKFLSGFLIVIALTFTIYASSFASEKQNLNSQFLTLKDRDSTNALVSYWSNGKIRKRVKENNLPDGINYKYTQEFFHRSGTRKRIVSWNWSDQLAYKAFYSKQGALLAEYRYIYDYDGDLIEIETRKNGVVTRTKALGYDDMDVEDEECQ